MDDKKMDKNFFDGLEIDDLLKADQEIEQEATNNSDQFNDSEMGDAIAIAIDQSFASVTASVTQNNIITQVIENTQFIALNINADLAD
ncbi:hypothetical protein V6C27_05035 [Peptococcaceae bacterium 1198_IL3148]